MRTAAARRDATNEYTVLYPDLADPYTGNGFQARHSYTAKDIEFDATFVPCMLQADSGQAKINWEQFHRLIKVPFNGTKRMVGISRS